jgi:hypothetical protein
MKAARFPLALVALSVLTACEAPTGQRSPSPTAPSPPAPSSQIIVQSMSPSSGATLPVEKCRYYPSSFNLDFWERCADGLSLRFEVEFEADVTNAVVTACMIDEDLAHQPGRQREKMGPALQRHAVHIHQPQVDLMNERRRLQCARRRFAPETAARHAA